MKKNVIKTMLLMCLLILGLCCTTVVSADQTKPVTVNWHVDYTSGAGGRNILDDSSFNAEEIDEKLGAMQPGDRIIFTITLNNRKSIATRWYMENEVMRSMERLATDTGAYSYKLSYNGSIINNSEDLGGATDSGDSANGMTPATTGLEDFFELGSIPGGGRGLVTLEIELEGESQGNSYQNAEARLRFHFAVDETGTTPIPTAAPGRNVTLAPTLSALRGNTSTIVKTGDESRSLLYFTMAGIAGVVLLVLAIIATKRQKEKQPAETGHREGGR